MTQVVSRYTEMVEALAPDLDDLMPGVYEPAPAPITVTVAQAPPRRSLAPALVMVVALLAVIAVAIPLWMMAADGGDPAAPPIVPLLEDTTPSVVENAESLPPTSPPNQTTASWPGAHIGIDEPHGTVNGHEWAPNSVVRVTKNGADEAFGRTDATGTWYIENLYDILPGDVIEVTVEGWTKQIVWRTLTLDVFDRETGLAAGQADFPDGTIVSLTVAPFSDERTFQYDATVVDGAWSLTVDEPLFANSSAGLNAFDADGDVYGWYDVPLP